MRVMVVDDDDFSAQVLGGIMRNIGFEVLRGRNGLDAMRVLVDDAQGIQLLITDVYMPEMNGLELFRTIKCHSTLSHLPVVLMSGLADINLITEAAKLGCTHFLVKPVKREKVQEKVRELLPMQRMWLKEPKELLEEHSIQTAYLHSLIGKYHDQTQRLLSQLRRPNAVWNVVRDFKPLQDSAELLGTDDLKELLLKHARAGVISEQLIKDLDDLRIEIEVLREKTVHRAREESALALLTAAEEKRRSSDPNEVDSETFAVAGRQVRRETGRLPKAVLVGPRVLSHELIAQAKAGNKQSQFDVGLAYLRNYGTPIEEDNALLWLGQAAEQQHPAALVLLALHELQTCDMTDEAAWQRAVEHFNQAAQHGSAEARYWLEKINSGGRSALEFLQLARSGDPVSQYKLGLFYDHGLEIDQNVPEAMFWLGLSAKQGYLDAQYRLGMIHLEERVAGSSHREAMRLFREASDLDHADAQYSLARMYNLAIGVPVDENLAIKWYEKAARQGHNKAQFELAHLHENAVSTRPNVCEALRWYLVSAASGFAPAAKRVADLQAHLGPEELHEAETLARATLESIGKVAPTAVPTA